MNKQHVYIYSKFLSRFKSSKAVAKTKDVYSKTICLPKTSFPKYIAAKERVKADEQLGREICSQELYLRQKEDPTKERFILHDGPPYANGELHMGHAVNKILKDIVLRWKLLDGYRVEYIPGWDCHGLPIELKANTKEEMSSSEIRDVARQTASICIQAQKSDFEHWGIMGDWENYYSTFSRKYVLKEIQLFWELYQKGLITRDFKPVYWSPQNKTALAEAELIYNEKHVSPSAYVGFPIVSSHASIPDNCQVLIWTTTPWTLVANQAICYRQAVDYIVVQDTTNHRHFIIAEPLKQNIEQLLNTKLQQVAVITNYLDDLVYENPLNGRKRKLFPAIHVKLDTGTGLVHTAPGHGFDDYIVALNNGLDLEPCVGEDGKYNENAGPLLQDLDIFTDGNEAILNLLGDFVVHSGSIVHSYPYDWRSHTPVIIRASMQWFMDTRSLREGISDKLQSVKVYPPSHTNSLSSFINTRPFWCISRQRCWGTPIPVFYDSDTGKQVVTQQLIDHLCGVIELHGPDAWWSLPIDDLVSHDLRGKDLVMKREIFDIWMDSGVSWSIVLDPPYVADIYLEGADQFSGWFQSSAILSYALRKELPFKNLFVHSFVVDEKGEKMSKSVGNVISPRDVTHGSDSFQVYGVDVLRWFVAYHSINKQQICFGPNIIKLSAENVLKIRGILRFCLGNLNDFNPSEDIVAFSNQLPIDRYLLFSLGRFIEEMKTHYQEYSFNTVCHSYLNFISNRMSSFYFVVIKDRLYCDRNNSLGRRSCQTTLYYCLRVMTAIISPILPHLSQEVYSHFPNSFIPTNSNSSSDTLITLQNEEWNNLDQEGFDFALSLFSQVKHLLAKSKLKKFTTKVICTREDYKKLRVLGSCESPVEDNLNELFGSTSLEMNISHSVNSSGVSIEENQSPICVRCRKYNAIHETLCHRCNVILKKYQ